MSGQDFVKPRNCVKKETDETINEEEVSNNNENINEEYENNNANHILPCCSKTIFIKRARYVRKKSCDSSTNDIGNSPPKSAEIEVQRQNNSLNNNLNGPVTNNVNVVIASNRPYPSAMNAPVNQQNNNLPIQNPAPHIMAQLPLNLQNYIQNLENVCNRFLNFSTNPLTQPVNKTKGVKSKPKCKCCGDDHAEFYHRNNMNPFDNVKPFKCTHKGCKRSYKYEHTFRLHLASHQEIPSQSANDSEKRDSLAPTSANSSKLDDDVSIIEEPSTSREK